MREQLCEINAQTEVNVYHVPALPINISSNRHRYFLLFDRTAIRVNFVGCKLPDAGKIEVVEVLNPV